jgi:hypothetical protein
LGADFSDVAGSFGAMRGSGRLFRMAIFIVDRVPEKLTFCHELRIIPGSNGFLWGFGRLQDCVLILFERLSAIPANMIFFAGVQD